MLRPRHKDQVGKALSGRHFTNDIVIPSGTVKGQGQGITEGIFIVVLNLTRFHMGCRHAGSHVIGPAVKDGLEQRI